MVRSAQVLLLITVLFLTGGTAMATSPDSSPLTPETRIVVVGFDHEREYVAGFPVFVALTVAARRKGTYFYLPMANFAGLGGAIAVSLVNADDGSRTAQFIPPPPHTDPEEMTGWLFQLTGSEQRRMLIDLSPIIPADIAPGIYHLTVGYHGGDGLAWSEWVQVKVRAPTAEDLARRAEVAGDRTADTEWPAWVQQPPADPARLTSAVRAGEPLRFVVLLRWLLHGPALAEVDPAVFSALDGVYAPESLALVAEVMRARGDQGALHRVLAELDERYPGLAWWARSLRESDGQIVWRRSD